MDPKVRTVVITGANRGIGRATAEVLAQRGQRVILTSRDLAAGEAARAAIARAVPGAQLEVRPLDLARLASIHAFADALRADTIDVLLHNAGVMQQSETRRLTADGIEETLGVNALAPLLLSRLLRDRMSERGRLVFVSSRLHLPGSRGTPVGFDFDDPELVRGYDPERAYKNSKLAVLWVAFELARRLAPRITSNAVCPGFVPTTAAASTHGLQRFFLRHVLAHAPFATKLETAARNVADMATSDALEGRTGLFYADGAPSEASADARDPELAARFWRWASARVGLKD